MILLSPLLSITVSKFHLNEADVVGYSRVAESGESLQAYETLLSASLMVWTRAYSVRAVNWWRVLQRSVGCGLCIAERSGDCCTTSLLGTA